MLARSDARWQDGGAPRVAHPAGDRETGIVDTQVGIIGAGPAGLLLAHLLQRAGIELVVLERHSRAYVETRIRAGVLEQGTVDLLNELGLGARLAREGLVHEGLEITFAGRRHRIDLAELTGGQTITVYGQHEVVKDLIAARLAADGAILFEAEGLGVDDLDGPKPKIRFRKGETVEQLRCDFVGGCDGFRGVCRPSIPEGQLEIYEHVYPFAWLGILAAGAAVLGGADLRPPRARLRPP